MTDGPFDFAFCTTDLPTMTGGEQLVSAIACDKLDMVRSILQASPELANFQGTADPLKRKRSLSMFSDRKDVSELTPLHVAAASFGRNSLDIFNLLVSSGGDLLAKDGQNTSVMKWAMISKNKPVLERIQELNSSDPVWKGKIAEAGTKVQVLRTITKAPGKLVSGVGKVLGKGMSLAGKLATDAFIGGARRTRKQKKQKKSTSRKH